MHNVDHKYAKTKGQTGRAAVAFASGNASPSERALISQRHIGPPRATSPARETLLRIMDLCGASVLLVLLAPALIAIAVAILVTDGGPATFAHRRIGRNGKEFRCYKFRTMYANAEQKLERLLAEDPALRRQWEVGFKLDRDPRVTALGQVLRTLSLDELPQLFNVLKGEMSLVGPRPITKKEAPRYGRYIAHYLSVRPGLSGIWQVSGRSDTTYMRRVAADVLYVRTRSVLLNIKILACTGSAVFDRRGAR